MPVTVDTNGVLSGKTVSQTAFGDFLTDGVNLNSTRYGVGGTGWLMQRYNAVTGAYAKETLSGLVAPGTGYFIKGQDPGIPAPRVGRQGRRLCQ